MVSAAKTSCVKCAPSENHMKYAFYQLATESVAHKLSEIFLPFNAAATKIAQQSENPHSPVISYS